jgi:hypothetical protein
MSQADFHQWRGWTVACEGRCPDLIGVADISLVAVVAPSSGSCYEHCPHGALAVPLIAQELADGGATGGDRHSERNENQEATLLLTDGNHIGRPLILVSCSMETTSHARSVFVSSFTS